MQRWMRRNCCLESETAAALVGGERIKRPPPSPSHHNAAAAEAKLVGVGSDGLIWGRYLSAFERANVSAANAHQSGVLPCLQI
jgi:hypothetical protein